MDPLHSPVYLSRALGRGILHFLKLIWQGRSWPIQGDDVKQLEQELLNGLWINSKPLTWLVRLCSGWWKNFLPPRQKLARRSYTCSPATSTGVDMAQSLHPTQTHLKYWKEIQLSSICFQGTFKRTQDLTHNIPLTPFSLSKLSRPLQVLWRLLPPSSLPVAELMASSFISPLPPSPLLRCRLVALFAARNHLSSPGERRREKLGQRAAWKLTHA